MKTKTSAVIAVALALILAACGKSEQQKQAEQAQRDAALLSAMMGNLGDIRAAEARAAQQQQATCNQRQNLREDIRAATAPRYGVAPRDANGNVNYR